jgi:hypothetical protein
MRNEDLLRQAQQDAERINQLSNEVRRNLNRETDWRGSRLSGYQPRESLRQVG